MLRQNGIVKRVVFVVLGLSTLAAGCVPDNLWSDIWGYTIVDGTVAFLLDAMLSAVIP
ncbi:MAG: hypothetical protein GXY44_07810 [Phycisphaerales bacterium]|nr:hypothetical protein [Phycisphaerales bacterium]